MSRFVERPRYLCTMGGAVATLKALPRAISILHASAGCGGNFANALNGATGYLGSGYCAGQALPSTNVHEKDIVFGGEDRLEEQIANTLDVVDGDLYFVVTGCMVDIIGDDSISVANRFRQQGKPVFAAETGGFKGNSFKGYDIVLNKLFAEFVEKNPVKDKQTVNLFGLVPIQDVFWKGNLNVLKALINKLGYKVNTFFGEGETIENLKKSAAAGLNIVVSDVYGIEPAKIFEETHGVPYIVVPLPIGPAGTEQFLHQVGAALGIERKFVDKVVADEKARYYGYVERLGDVYNDLDLQRYCVVVADANYAQPLAKFLADDLGWLPELVVITDVLSEEEQRLVVSRFNDFASGIRPKVVFDTDTTNVHKHLNSVWPRNNNARYYNSFSPAFVFGSSLDRDFAEAIGAPHLSVSYPISNRIVLDRAYAGYSGALRLVEDALGLLVGSR
ncbi:MAG TPA: nitrogenase component 1 [Methylomusa anaerophila]|uniref:Nitrogenase vanadium-iron protein alpha chain n=1 Tax=Methylomusa anaerophila TaxID=1930071 RepID=A0A348AEU8_9FIRM|nr:nitrogenase component 1 [Methylomusa anaerophila]BBB89596.1 nitrogenase vanadium-iron protein alpha chain [Methylomusa anaerophila]HML89631.1 nitrogenase component 1 [Methylomusa anaerophila]